MRETWYVLEDGRMADPADVTTTESGRLAYKDGTLVALRGNVPHSRGVEDADAERAKQQKKPASPPAPAAAPAAPPAAAQQKSQDGAYIDRSMKRDDRKTSTVKAG